MDKCFKSFVTALAWNGYWRKLANPTVARGKTAFPRVSGDQEKYGIRLDYDTDVNQDGMEYHLFKMQANQGKIPSSLKTWRDKNGTDAVMATVWVKADASKEEVEDALDSAWEKFRSS
ncbi:hypothetical protein D9613_011659 [Agrocybe pediades]|uniref:Uncharacterized protein n=1 Tax=Agrocybe pediades TaxID=84607 RepID=A0A8H4QVI0_9AGAR|nr:hypothetical protein D9613_011659 [Agrocybe pediades]KAF9553556.1 hypothetical protein CPC08DRAFT_697625 [Agrocybe pediades]